MGRSHAALPLVGLTEIAQRAGVQKQAVSMWRTRHEDFPSPVAELRTGAIWWWPDVRDWLDQTGRDSTASLSVAQVNESSPPVGRQPRERAAQCPRCRRYTWNLNALCDRCSEGGDDDGTRR